MKRVPSAGFNVQKAQWPHDPLVGAIALALFSMLALVLLFKSPLALILTGLLFLWASRWRPDEG